MKILSSLKNFLIFFKGVERKIFILFILAALSSISEIINPFLSGRIIDNVLINNINNIYFYIAIMIGFSLFLIAVNSILAILSTKIVNQIEIIIKTDIFNKIIQSKDKQKFNNGTLLEPIENDVTGLPHLIKIYYYIEKFI